MDTVLPLSSASLTFCTNRVMKSSPMKYVQALTLTRFSPSLTYQTTLPPFSYGLLALFSSSPSSYKLLLLSLSARPPPTHSTYTLSHIFFLPLLLSQWNSAVSPHRRRNGSNARKQARNENTAGHRKQAAGRRRKERRRGTTKNSSSVL